MITFGQFLEASSEVNAHMTHLEDSAIYGGVEGARFAITTLKGIRDTLSGSASKPIDISTKWDGAPSLFAGEDPTDGKFFVAKKGIFNKNPVVYKTESDIKADTQGDLQKKLLVAFRELQHLGIKGIVQGDIMFTRGDIKKENIDGKQYSVFQPNTIAYAVENGTDLAQKIEKAELGIVFHTSYSGSSFETLKASYGVDITKFKKTDRVWYDDAVVRDLSGKVNLTAEETKKVSEHLSNAGRIFNTIESSTLKEISANKDLAIALETFFNSKVRAGSLPKDSATHLNELLKWIKERYQKEIDARKTQKGKDAQAAARDEFLSFFSDKNKGNLIRLFDLQRELVLAKNIFIQKFNALGGIQTFLQTDKGYRVTGKEGFVAIDHLSNKAVKLVDRLEFSFANFSPSVIKGWQKNK